MIATARTTSVSAPATSGSGEARPLCRATNHTRISAPATESAISTSQFQA